MNRRKAAPAFIIFLLVLIVGSTILGPILAETAQKEAALNPAGQVHEMFRDAQGALWISDFFADEIWRVEPTSGAYTVYENLAGASDGRLDGNGHLWWSDFDGNALGRLAPGANQATLWPLSGIGNPLGIAFGDSGQVWVTDAYEPTLHRFAPANTQLCDYTMPNNGTADYILFRSGRVWLGDTASGRILRFNPINGNFVSWQLPAGAYPQGMAIDEGGQLWWADPGLGSLGRLTPHANEITIYTIPSPGEQDAEPVMVAINSGEIWYTDKSGSVGALDTALASGDTTTAAQTTTTTSPVCGAVGAGTAVSVTERSGTVNWVDVDYPLVHNDAGWLIYDLPNGGAPWGLAVSGNNVWFNDQGTGALRAQKLGWMQIEGDPPPTVTPDTDNAVVYLPVVMGK